MNSRVKFTIWRGRRNSEGLRRQAKAMRLARRAVGGTFASSGQVSLRFRDRRPRRCFFRIAGHLRFLERGDILKNAGGGIQKRHGQSRAGSFPETQAEIEQRPFFQSVQNSEVSFFRRTMGRRRR
jgi:hypothetical protein